MNEEEEETLQAALVRGKSPASKGVIAVEDSVVEHAISCTDFMSKISPSTAYSTVEEFNILVKEEEEGDSTYERRVVLVKYAGKVFTNDGPKSIENAAVSLMQKVDRELVWGDPHTSYDPMGGDARGEGPEIAGLKGIARSFPFDATKRKRISLSLSAEDFQEYMDENPHNSFAHVSPPEFVMEDMLPPGGAYISWFSPHLTLRTLLSPSIIPLTNWKDINGTPGPDFKKDRSVMVWYGALILYNPNSVKIHLA